MDTYDTMFRLYWRRARRFFSRTEWTIRILRLSRLKSIPGTGLLLVQIDGLSGSQLNRALQARRMPFLKKLLDRDRYVIHPLRSDTTSDTPVIQGGLFDRKTINPFVLPVIALLYLDIFLRVLAPLAVELVLALVDFAKGTPRGARVFRCVLRRELTIAGVQIDIARGVPVIQMNFSGSRFACWALGGIDDAIRRVAKAASAAANEYELWFYSDHGQEAADAEGFAFLPVDAPLEPRATPYMRAAHLREAASAQMGRGVETAAPCAEQPFTRRTFRIMTYNVHSCIGVDGKLSPDRIARVIARHDVDAIALQELDVGRARSGKVDQAERIARKLEMTFHFHPTHRFEDEQYGNAILSRYPMALIKSDGLPKIIQKTDYEHRGALWVVIETAGRKIQLFNTHLSLWPHERYLQTRILMGAEWVGNPACKGPVVLCGDFNMFPGSKPHRLITACGLRDTQTCLEDHTPLRTCPGKRPFMRIDHVFISGHFEVEAISVPNTSLDRTASDHLPLIADLSYAEPGFNK